MKPGAVGRGHEALIFEDPEELRLAARALCRLPGGMTGRIVLAAGEMVEAADNMDSSPGERLIFPVGEGLKDTVLLAVRQQAQDKQSADAPFANLMLQQYNGGLGNN